jgi:hypothetical protein
VIAACALAGVLSFLAPGWAAPTVANADTVVMTCKERGTVTWLSGGVAVGKTQVGWKNDKQYSDCVDPDGKEPGVYPVESVSAGTESASCDEVSNHEGTGILTWSNGSTSKIEQNASRQSKSKGNGTGSFTISIGAGNDDYRGDTATDVDTLTAKGICPGLTSATTGGTLTIYEP